MGLGGDENQRGLLRAIAALVQANVQVEMLILFGNYARGNWVEDHFTPNFRDFDLMAIVESRAVARDDLLWQQISGEIRELTGRREHTGSMVKARVDGAKRRGDASVASDCDGTDCVVGRIA